MLSQILPSVGCFKKPKSSSFPLHTIAVSQAPLQARRKVALLAYEEVTCLLLWSSRAL